MKRFFAKARPRRQPGEMNKLEQAYAALLATRKLAGEILSYEFERVTFNLAKDCRYTPDFKVITADMTVEFHEVKAGQRKTRKDGTPYVVPLAEDDGLVKIRAAANQFQEFRFCLAYRFRSEPWIVDEIQPL